MPPKVAPAAAAAPVAVKNLKIVVKLTKPAASTSPETFRVRLISEWLDCCGFSTVLGQGELVWETNAEINTKSVTFQASFETNLDTKDKLNNFNQKPGIYAVFVKEYEEHKIICSAPVSFSYIDCSSFILRKGLCTIDSIKFEDYKVDFTITVEKEILPFSYIITYEPLLLDVRSLNAFPTLEFEESEEALDSVYIYSELKFSETLTRTFLGFPTNVKGYLQQQEELLQGGNNNENNAVTADSTAVNKIENINMKTCILSGLMNDISRFKDILTSATFSFEIYKEDLYKRAFHIRNCEEYNTMLNKERGGPIEVNNAPAANAPAGKGGKAPAAAANKAPPVETISFGPPSGSDQFLLQCIHKALKTSRQINPHGTCRLRLEQLLSSSNDKLTKFSRKKNGIQEGDDNIVVKEDFILETRLEKPSKPEKWDIPTDISLRDAMRRAKEEAKSKLDGTLAINSNTMNNASDTINNGNTLSSTLESTLNKTAIDKKKLSKIPRHELFMKFGTNLTVTASLYRKILPEKLELKSSEESKLSSPAKTMPSSPTKLASSKSNKSFNASGSSNTAAASEKDKKSPLDFITDEELRQKLTITPFTRMVVLFKYLDDDTLWAMDSAITKVNKRALPDIQGTIRSYSFNKQELEDSIKGTLDVVTGFMIIDDDMRMIVIEGLAAPGCGMESIFIDLPRMKENDENLKILCNPQVLFPNRLYSEFGPDLRRIRIRDKLKKLARKPEIYNRKQVEEICFEGIDSVMSLRRSTNLKVTKELDMYPSAASLSKLELLYGEAITRCDMDGTLKREFVSNYDQTLKSQPNSPRRNKDDQASLAEKASQIAAAEAAAATATKAKKYGEFIPTDCHNRMFEESLKLRDSLPKHDFLAEHRELRKQAWLDMLRRREIKEQNYLSTLTKVLGEDAMKTSDDTENKKEPKIFLYSQQTLNFKEKAFNELRSRVAEDKNATYTFSSDFVSQTVCVVNEEEEKRKHKAEEKSKWLTEKGFQYPKTKTRKELITHKDRPSDARIEDLKEPFMDQTDQKHNANDTADPMLRSLEKGYKTQLKPTGLFGTLEPVQFERPFQLKLVGDREKLPRGTLTAGWEQDPKAMRSVHIGGEEQQKLIQEATLKEKEEWKSKVVVDTIDFKIGGFKIRDKPMQADRASDILKDPPHRNDLIHLREMKSHKGKDIGYKPTPLSIMSGEPYVQNASTNALVRKTDNTKFITATIKERDLTKPPQDFVQYINKNTFDNRIMTVLAKKTHPPQDRNSMECTGPKWDKA